MPLKKKAKKKAKSPKFVGRKVKLATLPGVDPKSGTVRAFETCWNILNDYDVFDMSGADIQDLTRFKEHFEDAFQANLTGGSDAYHEWWNDLNGRTDLSTDDKLEIDGMEWRFHTLVNLYDNLHTQGLV